MLNLALSGSSVGSERLSHSPKGAQLVSGRAQASTQDTAQACTLPDPRLRENGKERGGPLESHSGNGKERGGAFTESLSAGPGGHVPSSPPWACHQSCMFTQEEAEGLSDVRILDSRPC